MKHESDFMADRQREEVKILPKLFFLVAAKKNLKKLKKQKHKM